MNVSKLSDAELVDFIKKASEELSSRMATPEINRVQASRQVVTMREPPEDDKDFALMIKAEVQRGGYIKAAERERIADIAATFPEWIEHQKLPTGRGTGEWRKAAQRHTARRAREL